MDIRVVANVLRMRRILGRRERWTPEQLREHQQRQLAALRTFATERSPFYRRSHRAWSRLHSTSCPC